ncbi:MAG: YbaB/EbfC family nucleoid-associated protein [bacterium]|nr:YbaB/EbfC family nucleoid-associated protein [bacterium]
MFEDLKGKLAGAMGGDFGKMAQQAMAIKKVLAQMTTTVKKDGVEIVITGDQDVQSVMIDGSEDKRLRTAFNEAIKKSQEMAAKEMQSMMKDNG